MCLHKFVKLVTSSVPCKKILHRANICVSAHAISQPCRHTTSETFRQCYEIYTRYQIWNVASAQVWDFTAQMLWWWETRCFAKRQLQTTKWKNTKINCETTGESSKPGLTISKS